MISRKKILSKSCDELTISESDTSLEYDEDVWYHKDKLYQDHIQEILIKWDQIDDEIWGKLICMERNRRVAKAYVRAPVISVTGGRDGFDGYRIGLAGFENPHRDPKIEEIKKYIGSGVKIKIDAEGNVLVKRSCKSSVIVRDWHSEILEPHSSCIGDEVVDLRGKLNMDKWYKMFDMVKFQKNIAHEMKDAYPDRRRLEKQCIQAVSFVKDMNELLEVPCWIMIINVVALEVLKSKLQPVVSGKRNVALNKIFAPLTNKIKSNDDEGNYTDINSSINSDERKVTDGKASNASSTTASSTTASTSSSTNNHHHSNSNSNHNKNNSKQQAHNKTNKSDKISDIHLKSLDVRQCIEVPTPDYDTDSVSSAQSKSISKRISDPYYSGFMARVPDYNNNSNTKKWKQQYRGYLNSVLRLLPMNSSHNGMGKHSSSSGSFQFNDSDDIYGHIYSSIADAKSNRQNRHFYKHKHVRNKKTDSSKPSKRIAVS